MTLDATRDPIVVAIAVDDPLLADRIASILGMVDGVRLAARSEAADLIVVSPTEAPVEPTIDDRETTSSERPMAALLTPREREVLALLAEGASNKTIARRLGISVHTAKFHVGSLLDKLDASGRTDAVTHAARLGVIEL
ncbi:MAG TPA: helix-turn-helix transcriptional regulator [Casimicrobiaceae bacterium]|nr:helix-turn-helix transcriptional regulator [Casimicrobiaceae bacterium]